MKNDQEAYTKLDAILKEAFLGKEKVEASEPWQENVLNHIRNRGPLKVTTSYLEVFEQFSWRFAPVACVLIIMLTACMFMLDLVPEYEMVKLFVEDPIEFSYVQMLGA